MMLRVCGGGGIPQDHYYTLRAALDDGHEGRTLGRMFDPVTRNAAWARRGKGCSRRCGVTCRGEVEITAIITALAWIWRVGGVTAGVQVCTYDESCMRVCFLEIMAQSIAPTNSPPTDPGHFAESRVDLQHPCSGAATHDEAMTWLMLQRMPHTRHHRPAGPPGGGRSAGARGGGGGQPW